MENNNIELVTYTESDFLARITDRVVKKDLSDSLDANELCSYYSYLSQLMHLIGFEIILLDSEVEPEEPKGLSSAQCLPS